MNGPINNKDSDNGPMKDKERAEVKPGKRGPKTKGKILLTLNMLQTRSLIGEGVNTSRLVAERMPDISLSAVVKVLERMYLIGMVNRSDVSKNKNRRFVYSVNQKFKDSGKSYDDIRAKH